MQNRLSLIAVALALICSLPADAQAPLAPAAVVDVCNSLSVPPQSSPSPPAIKPPGQSVRVLAFGDFGDGGTDQLAVAKAMVTYHKDPNHRFDFGITLGDNFYGQGLNSPTHQRWNSNWEVPYGPMGIRIYATMGNHDYLDPASPLAEVHRSQKSKSWCLPAPYYTYTAGPVQFFAIDTDPIAREVNTRQTQLAWLEKELAASQARWKVVYGHHPVYSTGGEHGDTPQMIAEVLPLLKKYHVDVYLAGHDHDMQYLKPEAGVYFFVSGAGGHDKRDLGKDPEQRRLWAVGMTPGFTVLDAEEGSLSVSFFDAQDKRRCRVELTHGQQAKADCL